MWGEGVRNKGGKMDEYKGFEWKGKQVLTIGQIGDAACALTTPEEAAEFLAAYKAVNQHAEANIGYLMGYYGDEERSRVYRLMDQAGKVVVHPVFGARFGRGQDPTPEEAFEAGKKLGRSMLK
jgi:hypothetical protein